MLSLTIPANKVKVRFVNPPNDKKWSPGLTTYFLLKTTYKYEGKFPDRIEWLSPPQNFGEYRDIEDLLEDVVGADIYLFSSYIWNYKILDDLSVRLKEVEPNAIIVLGGPHIGSKTEYFKKHRTLYDFVAQPTTPGEYFIIDLLDNLLVGNYNPEDIIFELRNCEKKGWKFPPYSHIEDNFLEIKESVDFAMSKGLLTTFSYETSRGCPFKCTFCEWGGGLSTKLIKKDVDMVKQELLLLKATGVKDIFLSDSNFGVFFERDMGILRFTESIGMGFADISISKSRKIDTHIKLLTTINEITDSDELRLSFQTISDEAIAISDRLDLPRKDKYILAKEIAKLPSVKEKNGSFTIELILALPGSTIDDFYAEFDWLKEFNSMDGWRYIYMFLPDAASSDPEYQKAHGIKTVRVYQSDFDLLGESIDRAKSIFDDYKFEYDTMQSCNSYNKEEIEEMFFMNYAYIPLYTLLYEQLNLIKPITLSNMLKLAYECVCGLDEFKDIIEYISDLYDPDTPMRDVSVYDGVNIRYYIEQLVETNQALLFSHVLNRMLNT